MINSLGLRGNLPKKGKKIICALGDSFTESWGAPSDSTYPAIWQHLIPTPDSLTVINAGVSGSDPFYEFNLLQELTKEYTVHAAVFMINESDINDYISRGGNGRFLPHGGVRFRNGPWWEPFYAVSMVFRLIVHDVCGIGWSLMRQEEEQKIKQEAAKTIAAHFQQVVLPYCKARHIIPIVILQPILADLTQKSVNYKLLQDAFADVALPQCYDLITDAEKWLDPQKMYWPKDGHFTPLGYTTVAHLIHQNIGKELY